MGKQRPVKLLISAAEASGDLLAADLVRALGRQCALQPRGIAGPAMRAAGVEPIARSETIAVNGLWEVLGRLGEIRRTGRQLERAMEQGADLLVVVDAPDFHLPLARKARALGIPAVGYVSPQIWAWRRGRARGIAACLDRLLCLFPFEPQLYQDWGLDARFVGHPVADRLGPPLPRPAGSRYALLPGSRRHEAQRLLPVFLQAAELLRQEQPRASFVLGLAEELRQEPDLADRARRAGVEVVDGLLPAVRGARAALVASGTATLELAVLGVPMVVAYRVHASTYLAGRLLVRGVRHIALPNILAGRQIVPEHIQDLRPERLAADLLSVAEDPATLDDLASVRTSLGPGRASQRAAEALLDLCQP